VTATGIATATTDPFTPDAQSCLMWRVRHRDDLGVALRIFCGKLACPVCWARRLAHYRACFSGRTIRVVLADDAAKPWDTFTAKVRNGGGLYLAVPAASGRLVAFNTLFGEGVADPMALLAEALAARLRAQDDSRHISSSREWAVDGQVSPPHAAEEDDDEADDSWSVDDDERPAPALVLCADPPPGWVELGWSGAAPTKILEVTRNLDLDPAVFPPFARGPAIRGISFTMPALADPKRMLLEGGIRLGSKRPWQQRGVA